MKKNGEGKKTGREKNGERTGGKKTERQQKKGDRPKGPFSGSKLHAGGKPSIWFPPERFVKLSVGPGVPNKNYVMN